jgi:hypothetical protein
MASVSVDNAPVSINLSNSSTTVPTGEVWDVTIIGAVPSDVRIGTNFSRENDTTFSINNQPVASSQLSNAQDKEGIDTTLETQFPLETTVTGGDTLSHSGNFSIHVSGFVVSN